MKTFGKLVLGLTVAVTVPTSIAGVVFTAQHPAMIKDWFNGEQISYSSDDKKELQDLKNELAIYKELLNELESENIFLENKIAELELKIKELESQNAQEKVEITDFKFFKNSVVAYTGDSTVVENIPTGYSFEFIPSSEEIVINSSSDMENVFNDSFDYSSYLKVTFNDETIEYYDLVSFSAVAIEKGESIYPFKILVGEMKFFEGKDYNIDGISRYAFDGTNVDTVILPNHITSFELSNFYQIKKLIVNNETAVIQGLDFSNGETTYDAFEMYVPDSLYEEYLSDEIWSKYTKNIFKKSLNQLPVTNFNDYVFLNEDISSYQGTDSVIKLPCSYSKEETIYARVEGQNDNANDLQEEWGSNRWYVSFNNSEKELMDYSTFSVRCMGYVMLGSQYSYIIEKVKTEYIEGEDYTLTIFNPTTFTNENLIKIIIPSTYTEINFAVFANLESLRIIEIENENYNVSFKNIDSLSENVILRFVGVGAEI